MRGDSLRDFYAKTLAVLGLSLLAGAGAAVDYWPVGSPLPSVRTVRLPAPDVPMLAQHFDMKIPAPVVGRRVVVRGTILPSNVGTARFLTPSVAMPEPVAPPPPPVPSFAVPVSDESSQFLTSSVPFSADYVVASGTPSASDAPGFIGGALKKTKESLVRTGAVTGSTIADAFRGVFGAFKKVTPF